MQQHMGGGLVRRATGVYGTGFGSGARGQHHGVAARAGRFVVAAAHVAARPKYCRLRGVAAIAAPATTSRELFDQRARPGNTTSNNQVIVTVDEDRFFEIEMKVRDDELDEYGVVHNAIYPSYLHSGRDVLLEKLGISVDYWTSTGNAMALSELNLKYFAPLKSGDRFVVKVKPIQIKGVRIVVEHVIETLPDRKLVLEGRATAICLNKKLSSNSGIPGVVSEFDGGLLLQTRLEEYEHNLWWRTQRKARRKQYSTHCFPDISSML